MYSAWCNYGDCYFDSDDLNEVIDWLELEEDEILELEEAIKKGKTNISFCGGTGLEWD